MTNTTASALLAAYDAEAARIGFVEHPDFVGLVFTLGDTAQMALYVVDEVMTPTVRVLTGELVGEGIWSRFEPLTSEVFEAPSPDRLSVALDLAAVAVS